MRLALASVILIVACAGTDPTPASGPSSPDPAVGASAGVPATPPAPPPGSPVDPAVVPRPAADAAAPAVTVALDAGPGPETAREPASPNDAAGPVGDGAAVAPGSFACTQIMGPNVTGEWFAAGFEKLVPGDRWQVKAPHRSFVEDWANPNHAVWLEKACQGTFSQCETRSRCAGDKPVDRVVFVTQTGNYLGTSQKVWEDQITLAIKTIKGKYPQVKRVELMTFVRGPGNKSCGTETTVAADLDKAHAALAAASGGAITAAPRFEAPKCEYFAGAPHFSADGNRVIADLIGKHYAKEP